MSLLICSNKGWYCPVGDFYVDPTASVSKAFITHGHSDHARMGNETYFSTPKTAEILKVRLGEQNTFKTLDWKEQISVNGVKVSFHPAGHVPGSAQVRIEYKGEIWVVSGDYKTEDDTLSTPFEAVKCHTFISECTFGLPVFQWQPQQTVFEKIVRWHHSNASDGFCSVLGAYSLGKAQRLIWGLKNEVEDIWVHSSIAQLNQSLLPDSLNRRIKIYNPDSDKKQFQKALIIAPPHAKLNLGRVKANEAFASGWMALRGIKRRDNLSGGFVISDHADWPGLNDAVKSTGAETVVFTHGYRITMKKWFQEKGYQALIDTDLAV